MSDLFRVFDQFDRICFYASDPGAYALQREIIRRTPKPTTMYCDGWAKKNATATIQPVEKLFRGTQKSTLKTLLVLGAQTNFAQTQSMLKKAKRHGLKTAFIFDQWKNYTPHFQLDISGLPDYIFVPDHLARQTFKAAFRQKKPKMIYALRERLLICPQYSIIHECARVKAYKTNSNGEQICIFLDPEPDREDLCHYSPMRVLSYIKSYIKHHHHNSTVVIKPHPRQSMPELVEYLQAQWKDTPFYLSRSTDISELIANAKEVWGMTSVCLVIASLAGKSIKSFQWYDPSRSIDSVHPYLDSAAIYINKEYENA